MTIHTEFRKGQRIILMMKNGTKLVAKYVGGQSGKVMTSEGAHNIKDIRAISIFRPQCPR